MQGLVQTVTESQHGLKGTHRKKKKLQQRYFFCIVFLFPPSPNSLYELKKRREKNIMKYQKEIYKGCFEKTRCCYIQYKCCIQMFVFLFLLEIVLIVKK